MRCVIVVALLATSARAEVSIGGAIGAGAQGAATYSALELRLDGQWQHARLGLGARGVWDDAAFRRREWASPWHAVAIVRDAGAHAQAGDTTLAIAAGALAPAHVGALVDGYRVSLDDRWRTGVRAAARSPTLDARIEIDDVLDPALIAGGARWLMAPPWGMHASVAVDPGRASALEAGAFRRFEGDRTRADGGVSIVAEISRGASIVAFATGAIERGDVRLTARADARAGTGSLGTLFGPLYRIERLALAERAGFGIGAGVAAGLAAPTGWLELGVRARPDAGGLVVASAGAPLHRRVQAGVWTAIGRDEAAGAAELRVAWANTLFSALHAARLYRLDVMEPFAVWSLTAWFGAASQ